MNTPLEENAVEIESPNEERSEVSAEVTPFRKPDSDQYTKSGEGTSPRAPEGAAGREQVEEKRGVVATRSRMGYLPRSRC